MTLSLFALIGWLTIIIFSLIPKSLSTEDNIIMFFLLNIATISIYTILTLNLRLLTPASNVRLFISLWIQRSIIIPVSLLILMNLLILYNKKSKKFIASAALILILTFIDLLTVWTGVKNYTGWSPLLTASTLVIQILLFYILTKLIMKIS